MSEPLRLPSFIKRPARVVRDHPITNRVLSAGLKRFPKALQRKLMGRVPRIGRAAAKLPNGKTLRMQCESVETVLNAIYYHGWTGEEPEVLPVWYSLAERAETIIDVGAHVGHLSLVAGLANPKAALHSFEPLPRVARLLRRNLAINQVRGQVHEMALSRESGELSFYAIAQGIPSSSSLSHDFMSSHADLEEICVKVGRLDEIVPDAVAPVLIKVDTETTEPDVLAGAPKLLAAARPVIFVEVLPEHDTGEALHKALDAAGYAFTPYLLTAEGPKRRDRIAGNAMWRNYLLVPSDGPSADAFRPVLEKILAD